MKKTLLNVILTFALSGAIFAQESSRGYEKFDSSSGFEFIFGWAGIEGAAVGTSPGNPSYSTSISENMDQNVRFTAFLHFQHFLHINFNKNLGMMTGLTMRNVGFIVEQGENKSKYRTYTIGIPLALKIGDMGKHLSLYAGGEAGFAFNFKEKHFKSDDKKLTSSEWFSGKTNWFQPNVFVGIQFAKGTNLKFAYYPMNFFNEDYSSTDDFGNTINPFDGVNVNLFYSSISFQLFHSDLRKAEKQLREKQKNTGATARM